MKSAAHVSLFMALAHLRFCTYQVQCAAYKKNAHIICKVTICLHTFSIQLTFAHTNYYVVPSVPSDYKSLILFFVN